MNIVFVAILICGLIALLFISPESALSALLAGSDKGLMFSAKLFSIYAVWLSVLNIWRSIHFDDFLARKMRKVLTKIFPGENEECYMDLAVNLSSNILGMGSAGTPAGMKAIAEMKEKQNRVMLLVINSTSIQLIPTTVVALRSSLGASTDIILPTLLATTVTTFIGFFLVKIFVK